MDRFERRAQAAVDSADSDSYPQEHMDEQNGRAYNALTYSRSHMNRKSHGIAVVPRDTRASRESAPGLTAEVLRCALLAALMGAAIVPIVGCGGGGNASSELASEEAPAPIEPSRLSQPISLGGNANESIADQETQP